MTVLDWRVVRCVACGHETASAATHLAHPCALLRATRKAARVPEGRVVPLQPSPSGTDSCEVTL